MNLSIVIRDGLNSEACQQIHETIKIYGEDCVELHIAIIKAYARYFGFDLTQKLNNLQFHRCWWLFRDEMILEPQHGHIPRHSAAIKAFAKRVQDGLRTKLELLIEPRDNDSNPSISNDDVVKRWKHLDFEVYFKIYHGVWSLELCVLIFRDYAAILGIDLFSKDITLREVKECMRAVSADILASPPNTGCWLLLDIVIRENVLECSRDKKGDSFHLFRDDSDIVNSRKFRKFEADSRHERKKRERKQAKKSKSGNSCNAQYRGDSDSDINKTATMVCPRTIDQRDSCLPPLVESSVRVERCQDVDDGPAVKASTKGKLVFPPMRSFKLWNRPSSTYKNIDCETIHERYLID
mmetsp:Transcript_22355/g.29240  ORF Transcript_22355/g.29240 Transcript_22355/m.29240 type:complete len:352 (+) Transcript_22355:67-1122(+)